MATPDDPRQAVLNPVEGGRWSVTLSTGEGSAPPADHTELLHAAGTLRHPLLRDLIESATPLGPVYSRGRTGNRRRHYEKLRRWPDQFLVVGDALAALDPAHGHGMTLAVQCALVLDHLLTAHGTAVGISHRLRRALAHQVAPAWQSSTRTPGPSGGLRARLGRRYASRIAAAATTDPHAAALLLHLHQTLAPPAALRPHALRAALRPARRTPPRRRPPAKPTAPRPAAAGPPHRPRPPSGSPPAPPGPGPPAPRPSGRPRHRPSTRNGREHPAFQRREHPAFQPCGAIYPVAAEIARPYARDHDWSGSTSRQGNPLVYP